MDLEARATTTRQCSEKSRQSEKETPRSSKALTPARPGTGGGMDGKSAGVRGPLTIISRDFDTCICKFVTCRLFKRYLLQHWLNGSLRKYECNQNKI